jgi:choline-sulfatase
VSPPFERIRSLLSRGAPRRTSGPNVLWILSDEHQAAVAGCYGSAVARTPHLDALAARGTVFDAAYCPSPLCGPSRHALTAGKYVSRVGAWGNACWLPSDDVPSIARAMAAGGYEPLLCGKQHYDASRRYGFHELGRFRTNRYYQTGIVQRRAPDALAGGELSRRFRNFRVGDDSAVLRHDREVTERASRFLAGRRRGDPPFFLLVGYLAPHFPLIVPEPWVAPFRGRVPPPALPPGHVESLPRNYRLLRAAFGLDRVPPEVVQSGRELYHGLVSWLDDQIGMLLASLAASRAADDTVVIYASDHGENLGEHGLWWKNCMFEPAARVPLVVSWPARWAGGARRGGACSLLDVVRTVLDLGGVESPEDWNGRSLEPWLDDAAAAWPDLAVSEYYGHNVASGMAMVRRGPWKYVYHTAPDADHPAERELYDLASDPGELRNLAGHTESAARIAELHAALERELGEPVDAIEARCRAEIVRGYGRPPRPD